MDFLKRELAPLTDEAWAEIDERAREVLETHLSGRKAVHVVGPRGLDFNAITEGRLDNIVDNDNGVKSGVYQVKPLTEARAVFELNRWELDNLERGAKDIELGPMEDTVKQMAAFEDNAIFNGLASADIEGLKTQAANTLKLGTDCSSIMENLSRGTLILNEAIADKPYTLVVGEEAWTRIHTQSQGYPLTRRIENLLGSEIVLSRALDGALLVPQDHDDLEFTIGQDFAIGYKSHDTKKVELFITESFTFRVMDPEIIVNYTL